MNSARTPARVTAAPRRQGRPREFDADLALDEAMALFWERGYEATSVQVLTDRLGIARGSLYAAFGDKQSLYQQALSRYRDVEGARWYDRLATPGPVLPTVRALLLALADEACEGPRRRGCFIVNAIAERVPADADTTRQVAAQLARIEEALYGALRRAQHDGEVPLDRDVRTLARFLTSSIQGLRLVAKATGDRASLHAVVEATMHALR